MISTGLSDPFCVLGIVPLWKEYETETSNGSKSQMQFRHDILADHLSKDSLSYTKVQKETLTPTWDEQFRL